MKNIIDAFGFEWRVAPGEAEAELAYLNRIGIIDAVLSDDVDNFLFGATMVIRKSVLLFTPSALSHILTAQAIRSPAIGHILSKTHKERTMEIMLLPTQRTPSCQTLWSPSLVQVPSLLAFSQVVTTSPLVFLAAVRSLQPVSPVVVSAILS